MPSAVSSAATSRHREVTRLMHAGDLQSAQALCGRLLADFPDFVPGWHSSSFIALCRGQLGAATESIERALARAPADPVCLLQYARCLAAERRIEESITTAATAALAAANDAPLLDAVGSFYSSI